MNECLVWKNQWDDRLWSRTCLPFWSTWVYIRFLVGFVLLNIWFSVWCFEYSCLYFFFWSLCCLSCFDFRPLITPLVSSNFSQLKQDLIPFGKETYNRHGSTIWNDLSFEQYDERGCLPFLFIVFPCFRSVKFIVFRAHRQIYSLQG
jgi:hypothetical protein